MCTRFYIDISDRELADIVAAAESSPLKERFLSAGNELKAGEIRPTDVAPVIACSRTGKRTVFPMKWGFSFRRTPDSSPSWVVNARSETAGRKQMFRDAWASHRCIIPASYYYEWQHKETPLKKEKIRFAIQPEGSALTCLCGLYRIEDGLPHFVVLTRPPSEDVDQIHDRMPLILPEHLIDQWIDPRSKADLLLLQGVNRMICERAD